MTPYTNLMAVLTGLGYRATAPRKVTAKLLGQKRDGFTAEALSEELPSVGWATGCRTIKLSPETGRSASLPRWTNLKCKAFAALVTTITTQCASNVVQWRDAGPRRPEGCSAQSAPKFRGRASATVLSCAWPAAPVLPAGLVGTYSNRPEPSRRLPYIDTPNHP